MIGLKTLSITAVLIVVSLSAAACGPGTSSTPGERLLQLINEKRAAADCPAVIGNDQLRSAADREVVDMRDNNAHLQPGTDGHTGSDGSRPFDRIAASGFAPISATGEVLYWSSSASSPEQNIEWWMGSPPHRRIILDCSLKYAGVGLVYPGGTKWYSAVDFASH